MQNLDTQNKSKTPNTITLQYQLVYNAQKKTPIKRDPAVAAVAAVAALSDPAALIGAVAISELVGDAGVSDVVAVPNQQITVVSLQFYLSSE